MPLCTLEIPRRDFTAQGGISAAKKLCDEALTITLNELNIPDPEDREMRVVDSKGLQARLSIAFTTGENEYPDFPGKERFDPQRNLTRAVGKAIYELATHSPFRIQTTRMEAWKNTSFAIRSTNPENKSPRIYTLRQETGLNISEARLVLVVQMKNDSAGKVQKSSTEMTKELIYTTTPL